MASAVMVTSLLKPTDACEALIVITGVLFPGNPEPEEGVPDEIPPVVPEAHGSE